MLRFALICLVAVLPVRALALSCLPPDLARDFKALHAAEETYAVAVGTMSDKRDEVFFPDGSGLRKNGQLQAVFTFRGRFLTGQSGAPLGRKTDVPVRVTTQIMDPWSAGFSRFDTPMMIFLQRHPDGSHSYAEGLCGGPSLTAPTEAQIQAMTRCLARGRCSARDGKALGHNRR